MDAVINEKAKTLKALIDAGESKIADAYKVRYEKEKKIADVLKKTPVYKTYKDIMREKGIPQDKMWLLEAYYGSEAAAKEAIKNKPASELRDAMKAQSNKEQDALYYRGGAGNGVKGGGSSSWGNEFNRPTTEDYLLNLYDIDDVADEEYYDQYFGIGSNIIKKQIQKKGWNIGNFKEEEIDLAGRYPFKAMQGHNHQYTAIEMQSYIANKHDLSSDDNTKVNAWKHAYLAALHKDAFGLDVATKFVNAHENTPLNLTDYRDSAVMDLHNNAIGLSIDRPEGINDKDFADYVYSIIENDGYWISPEGEVHIPEWAKNDE